MAIFAYNNTKNTSPNYKPFKLNCGYHPCVLYKNDVNPYSQSKSVEELAIELKKLLITCQRNLQHAQEL